MAEQEQKVESEGTKVEVPVETKNETPEKEYSELEQSALTQGWQDKDAWVEAGHSPEDHRSAREFIDRGELLGKLKANSNEMRQLRDALGQMSTYNQRVYQAGIEQGIRQLQQERKNALKEGDVDHAVALEERIDAHKETLAQARNQARAQVPQMPQGQSPEFQQWVARNSWFLEDNVLHHWSKGMAIEYARVNPDASEEEVYRFLDREVRKHFPAKFKKVAPPSPDGGGRQASSKGSNGGKSEFDKLLETLPDDEAKAARNLVKNVPGLTPEKYVADYRLINREN